MSRLPDSEPGASPPSEAPRSPAKAPRPPAKAPRPSEPRAFLCDPERALASGEFELLARTLERRRALAVGGLWGASQALCLAVLSRRLQGPWLALVSTEAEGVALASDLEQFGAPALRLASRGDGARGQDDLALRERLITAQILCGPPAERPRLLVASVLSMLERVPEPGSVEKDRLSISKGQRLNLEELLRRLVDAGYTRVPLVERPGELSLRGEILDVFPRAAELPLRIEMFDDAVESLRRFDPALQTSVETLNHAAIFLASDPGGIEDGGGIQPHALLSPTAIVVEFEPLRIEDRAEGLRIQSPSHQRALTALRAAFAERLRLSLQSLPASDLNFETRSVQALGVGVRAAPAMMREITADGTRISVACRTEAERERLSQVLAEAGLVPEVELRVGAVSKGFRWPALGQVVVDHREIAGITSARRASPARVAHKTRALQSFFELKPGDYVVHAVHGVALYRGLTRMSRGGGEEDHLHLEFADEVSLYVPGSRIDLVQRYVGAGGAAGGAASKGAYRPPLDKIGGQSFRRRREKVERALFDLAGELLEVQAKRELSTRPPWRPDDALVASMKGEFSYEDTADQAVADQEIAANLAGEHPMDRLLCGDVGFGKTEIAIRAAFRVAASGGQVAVLVPTTVLAHQHYLTFKERLADFALELGVLSRTVAARDSKELVRRIENGEVDIVVGTHRLLSKDVRFKRLGLVIIDEEQRFGVTHKEHFKALRERVDILTLSATPIPRTLHMSLSGVRDISALSVPPPGRQEIETLLVDRGDDAFLREAFLREKNRGGQIFFMHNRVQSIVGVAQRLSQLVPECSFAVGHGQMNPRILEGVMDQFSSGDADCLVATTIVENGLDIPAAGTIFIDEADHFGLAELHQLRGRVGRGEHKAHCYLLVDPHKPMREVARDRLKALEELTQLGAGFQISMKDLEIRGAGNILGPEQSGHIAAIGYDMYCRLLKLSIERMRSGMSQPTATTDAELTPGVELELGLKAYLPAEWIPTEDARLEALRSLDAAHQGAELDQALSALRDRYGRVPATAEALVRQFRLRFLLEPLSITRLAWRNDAYLVEYSDRAAIDGLASQRVEWRNLRTGVAHLVLPKRAQEPAAALAWLESLLQAAGASPKIPTPRRP